MDSQVSTVTGGLSSTAAMGAGVTEEQFTNDTAVAPFSLVAASAQKMKSKL